MKKILMIITVLFVVIACSKTVPDNAGNPGIPTPVDCSGAAKSFTADVHPIIQNSCASASGCHSAGSTNGPGELITFSQISNARNAIRSAVISGQMPKNGSLTTAQKNSIICWIDNGATNN